jgi:hypothetical protein
MAKAISPTAGQPYQPVDEVVVQLRGSGSKVTAMAAV